MFGFLHAENSVPPGSSHLRGHSIWLLCDPFLKSSRLTPARLSPAPYVASHSTRAFTCQAPVDVENVCSQETHRGNCVAVWDTLLSPRFTQTKREKDPRRKCSNAKCKVREGGREPACRVARGCRRPIKALAILSWLWCSCHGWRDVTKMRTLLSVWTLGVLSGMTLEQVFVGLQNQEKLGFFLRSGSFSP